jgi:hypothetical protein
MSRKKYEHPLHEQLLRRLQHEYEIYQTSVEVRQAFYAGGRVKDLCRQIRELEIPPRGHDKFLRALKLLTLKPCALGDSYPEGLAAVRETISSLEQPSSPNKRAS